jgi:hypothetical protein
MSDVPAFASSSSVYVRSAPAVDAVVADVGNIGAAGSTFVISPTSGCTGASSASTEVVLVGTAPTVVPFGVVSARTIIALARLLIASDNSGAVILISNILVFLLIFFN